VTFHRGERYRLAFSCGFLGFCGFFAVLRASAASGETLSKFIRRAARDETERTRYILDDEAAQRLLTALEQPSPASEQGLRRLIEKPSVLPKA